MGTKGDWPFVRSSLALNCGYNCTKKCHLCDLSASCWQESCTRLSTYICLGLARAAQEWWDVKVQLKELSPDQEPSCPFKPERYSPLRKLHTGDLPAYIKIDPAHTYAIEGVGKSFLASCIIALMRMNVFGRGTVDRKFDEAYSRFQSFCRTTGRQTTIQSFDHGVLKLPPNSLLDKLALQMHFLLGP